MGKVHKYKYENNLIVNINAKINRGRDIAEILKHEVDVFRSPDNFQFIKEKNSATYKGLTSKFDIYVKFKQIPDLTYWSLLLSEILHHWRGALDNLVYAIAIYEAKSDPPPKESSIMFPIISECDNFEEKFEEKSKQLGINTFSDEVLNKIKSIQPGNNNGMLALEELRELNDRDKHRRLSLIVISPSQDAVKASMKGLPNGKNEISINANPLMVDQTNNIISIITSRPIQGIEFDGRFRFQIEINAGDKNFKLDTLNEIHSLILSIYNSLISYIK